jgi:hypothetical protein
LLALFYAAIALATGIADAFVDMSLVKELIFHSVPFHIALFFSLLGLAWITSVVVDKWKRTKE